MEEKTMMSRLLAGVLPGIVSALLALQPAQAADYKVGVLAKDGAAKAKAAWQATADYLAQKLPGDTFTLVPLGFDEVYPAVEKNEVHFFVVNSSMFVTARDKHGAGAIATMVVSRQGKNSPAFGGVIFTRAKNAAINGLADLKGKSFMAVDAKSFGGWQMAQKALLDAGVDSTKDFTRLSFGGTHENVVLAVQNGDADAGTVRTDTLEGMAAAGDIGLEDFKVLNKQTHADFPFVVSTPLYPEWPMAKSSGTDAAAAAKVADALVAMKPDDKAAKDAKVAGWSKPLDYGPVEALQKTLGDVK
jgi:twitching motility protein PilJ